MRVFKFFSIAALATAWFAGHASAEIPRCLNDLCIGERFSEESSPLNFENVYQDREVCPRTIAYRTELETGSIIIHINADNEEIHKIERRLYFDKDENDRSIREWQSLLTQRYGRPSRGPHVDPERPWWRFNADTAGSAGSDRLYMNVVIALSDNGYLRKFPDQIFVETTLKDPSIWDVMMPDRQCVIDQLLPD